KTAMGDKIFRSRKKKEETKSSDKIDHSDNSHGALPIKPFNKYAHADASHHATKGRPSDIKPHNSAKTRGSNFFCQISHGNRGNAAEHKTKRNACYKQPLPVI